MPIIVIVITGTAPYLCRLPANEGDDRMICNATALNAMIVDYVAESIIVHRTASNRSISKPASLRLAGRDTIDLRIAAQWNLYSEV